MLWLSLLKVCYLLLWSKYLLLSFVLSFLSFQQKGLSGKDFVLSNLWVKVPYLYQSLMELNDIASMEASLR